MQVVDRVLRRWKREPFPVTGAGDLFVRDPASASGLMTWIVLASTPALLAGLAANPSGLEAALQAFMPVLFAALLVSLVVHVAFSFARNRVVDPAWFMHGWLFALLAPHDMSLVLVAGGMGSGVVFGSLIFGGSGRNIVSPALLGIVSTQLAYAGVFKSAGAGSGWQALASGETLPAEWLPVFIEQSAANVGSVSAAACLFGAIVLFAVGVASLRVILGALAGAAVAAAVFRFGGDGSMPGALLPHWHWVLGSFAFCTAFILTDPSAQAVSRPGRWLYGALAGFLTVTIRVMNPDHPEGTLAACLFAMLFAPVIDQVCMRVVMWRRHRRSQ